MTAVAEKPRLLDRVRAIASGSLNVLNRMPQGSTFNDSDGDQVNCTPTFPFHFDIFVPSNILSLNYGKLSFFLRAFRSDVAGANSVTSGPSSAASSGSSSSGTTTNDAHHHHITVSAVAVPGVDFVYYAPAGGVSPYLRTVPGGPAGTVPTDTDAGHTHDNPHSHNIPHTHDSTASLAYGIFEGAVATGVTVKINGTDRTAALGGGTGFTTNQTELEVAQWLNIGAWNTIDLTPTGLGRIAAHLRLTGYIQST